MLGDNRQADPRKGLLCGLAAYGLWGVMPLYFSLVRHIPPLEMLVHRIVWSAVLLGFLITGLGRWGEVGRCLRRSPTRWLLLGSTILIAINWFVFIYGVSTKQVVQNSLGYFINPLVSVLLGVVVFRERLRPLAQFSCLLAGLGLVYLIWSLGELPWIALVLANSFGLYGLLRKLAPVDALVGLTVETVLLLPVALAFLLVWGGQGTLALGHQGWKVDLLLLASGLVTTVPLLFFGAAARNLPLSTLGFIQYLAPTLQFLLAVLIFGEPFRPAQQVSFGCIWFALVLVTVDSVLARRKRAVEPRPVAPLAEPKTSPPSPAPPTRQVR